MRPAEAGSTPPALRAPRVSVITVCRDAVATIEACLRSVAQQSFRDIEHVVIDGGSTDGTLEILRRHAGAIATLVSEPDRGIYDAMNKGIARARGTFVIFLNADDVFAGPDALRHAMTEIDGHPDADVYYGGLVVRDGDAAHRYMPPPAEGAAEEMVLGCLPHQATLARRSVFERTGLFDLRWRRHADYDWWLKVLADPGMKVRRIATFVASFALGGASSELAKGQPEVFAIQNASPLYNTPEWDKRRIELLQGAWLRERIEAARLRETSQHGGAVTNTNWKGRLAARLPPSVVRILQAAKRRAFGS